MFFRFGCAVVLVVLVSLGGVALEKENLRLRREVSRQHYRLDVLRNEQARLRLRTQELGAPTRLIDSIESGKLNLKHPDSPRESQPRRLPLLRWQR